MKLWRSWRRLHSIERRLIVRTLILLGAVRIVLWVLPFKAWRWALRDLWERKPAATEGAKASRPASPEQVAWAVQRGARAVPAATCLVQAVVAQMLLRRYGHDGELHIGVAKNGRGNVEAHAWVETGGRILVGWVPEISSYRTLPPPGIRRQ